MRACVCVCALPHCLLSAARGCSDGCRMLELLNLSWCDQITRDGIEALARGCNGIRALFLRGCTQVTAGCCFSSASSLSVCLCFVLHFTAVLCKHLVVTLTSWETPLNMFFQSLCKTVCLLLENEVITLKAKFGQNLI